MKDIGKVLLEADLHLDGRFGDLCTGNTGDVVIAASKIVGENGLACAITPFDQSRDHIESRAQLFRAPEVQCVTGDYCSLGGVPLADGTFDLLSLIEAGPGTLAQPLVYKEVARLLSPNGHLLVVEWNPGSGGFGPSDEKRLLPARFAKMVAGFGFAPVDEFPATPHHWGMLLRPRVA